MINIVVLKYVAYDLIILAVDFSSEDVYNIQLMQ